MKLIKHILLVFLISQYCISCSKTVTTIETEPDDISAYPTVSYLDSTINFSNYKTIAFADSTVIISNTVSKEITTVQQAFKNSLSDSLSQRGFVVTNDIAGADLVLNLTKVDNISQNILSSNYWNNYNTYYNSSIYGLQNATFTANFNNAQTVKDVMLSFELLDVKNKSNNTIHIIWNGILTEGIRVDDINSVAITIQGFMAQTPKLKGGE